MHTIFASQDAVYLHICSGNRLEIYAGTPAVVCVLKVAEQVHQSVPPVLAHTAASVLQVSATHNLLLALLAAVLYVITAQVALLAAATVETSTAVAAYHICTGCAILEMQDHVMFINLLLLPQEFSPLMAAMLHQWLKKIQNTLSGQELVYTSTCIPYMV
jgi:hypothetical protein